MTQNPDPRQEAFDLLLPAAIPTRDALQRVGTAVAAEIQQVRPLRKAWRRGQRNQSIGFSRFVYAVDELRRAWAGVTGLQYASSASQEDSNLFLWTLKDRWPLRVKHEPVEGEVNPGARQLLHLPVLKGEPTIYLTWDESEEREIVRARFATVKEPKWSISLAQLVAVAERPDSISSKQPLARVSSSRVKQPARDAGQQT